MHPCDEYAAPASKIVMRQTAKEAQRTGPLSSSFAATPKIMRAVLRRPPPRRPATELLEKATWRDYLGVVPNPGHAPNSLLFGKGKGVYEVRRCWGGVGVDGVVDGVGGVGGDAVVLLVAFISVEVDVSFAICEPSFTVVSSAGSVLNLHEMITREPLSSSIPTCGPPAPPTPPSFFRHPL